MDMHVHLAQEYVPKAERPEKIEPEFSTLFAANAAEKTLMAGFTSVRNLGDGGMETKPAGTTFQPRKLRRRTSRRTRRCGLFGSWKRNGQ